MDPNMMQGLMSMVQQRLAEAKDKADATQVTGQAGGGMVKVVATGGQQIVSVTIDPRAVDPDDKEMLEDLILAATNDALRRGKEAAAALMQEATGGLPLPPGLL